MPGCTIPAPLAQACSSYSYTTFQLAVTVWVALYEPESGTLPLSLDAWQESVTTTVPSIATWVMAYSATALYSAYAADVSSFTSERHFRS